MREGIGKFRGKRTDNGEWVTGYPFRNDYSGQWYIRNGLWWNDVEVIPETVGECVILFGKEYCEGDIFKRGRSTGVIVFAGDCFHIEWKHNPEKYNDILLIHVDQGEVIGNVFDNPELLNGKEDGKGEI